MSVLVLVFAATYLCSGATSLTTSQTTASPVSARGFTIYFVVDGSESISNTSFQIVKDALNGFVSTSQSIGSVVKIGVVVYSNNVTNTIPASSNTTALSTEINKISHPRSGTFTHLGISRASALLSKEPDDTSRVMIVMTDGLSNYPSDTEAAAAEARNYGITIFSVGVCSLFDVLSPKLRRRYETALRTIASSNETVFLTKTFSGLPHIMGRIYEILSSPKDGGMSEWGPWNVPVCPPLTCENPSSNRTVTRTRACNNPPPTVSGRPCSGDTTETERRDCYLVDCGDDSSSFTWQQAVGISIGVVALLGLIVITACVVCRRNTRQKEKKGAYFFKEKPFVPDRLELIALLGEGKFGEVWKARALNVLSTGHWDFVAVKKCKGTATEAVRQDFKHEIELMKSVPKHPHIVNYLSSTTKAGTDMLILELAPLGNLLNLLRSRRPRLGAGSCPSQPSPGAETQELKSEQLTMFAHQVARGMKHLQYNRIIHRDLAARNVLLGDNLVCKVSDLGLARKLSDTDDDAYESTSGGPLPIRWMAPESLKDILFSTKSDVWSFGILLWEIVTLGASPYPGQSARDVMSFVTTGGRMPKPDHCAPELFSLMTKCWLQDPESRPDFVDLSSELDTLLEESGDYIKLSDYQDHLYLIVHGESGDLEEKV